MHHNHMWTEKKTNTKAILLQRQATVPPATLSNCERRKAYGTESTIKHNKHNLKHNKKEGGQHNKTKHDDIKTITDQIKKYSRGGMKSNKLLNRKENI